MKKMAMLAACAMLAGVAGGQTFQLKDDATGKMYGPFAVTDGTRVTIDNKTYTLVRPRAITSEPTLMMKLNTIKIPQISFREANVQDVFDFYRKSSEELSPWKEARHKGVNILLRLTPEELAAAPAISFTARDLTLIEAIKATCSAAGLECEVQEKWVSIRARPRKGQ